jgi:hypothetical protein
MSPSAQADIAFPSREFIRLWTRRAGRAIAYKVPYITTMSAAEAATDAISALRSRKSIQERTGHLAGAGKTRFDAPVLSG